MQAFEGQEHSSGEASFHRPGKTARTQLWVIPTNEELIVAQPDRPCTQGLTLRKPKEPINMFYRAKSRAPSSALKKSRR